MLGGAATVFVVQDIAASIHDDRYSMGFEVTCGCGELKARADRAPTPPKDHP